VLDQVRRQFRPEFLNRLDELVVFHRLAREHMRGIVDIQLGRFRERLAARGMTCEITDAAKDVLLEAGWDPQYGARPLKRALQRLVENELARRVLAGDFVAGDVVVIDAALGGQLVFRKRAKNGSA
jgi:ATP-dependent Clp protease ATP-binding subunit ClpB